jgi:DNA-binding CsgD family transcriptional regulator
LISDREHEVARLVALGLSTPAIAQKLSCAPSTVKTHRSNLMRKLGVKNAVELVSWLNSNQQPNSP